MVKAQVFESTVPVARAVRLFDGQLVQEERAA
jgi:hypothetical protein